MVVVQAVALLNQPGSSRGEKSPDGERFKKPACATC
jgi:hypothetical protein